MDSPLDLLTLIPWRVTAGNLSFTKFLRWCWGSQPTAAGSWAPLGTASPPKHQGTGLEPRVPSEYLLEFTKVSCPSPKLEELASEGSRWWTFIWVLYKLPQWFKGAVLIWCHDQQTFYIKGQCVNISGLQSICSLVRRPNFANVVWRPGRYTNNCAHAWLCSSNTLLQKTGNRLI